MRATREMRWEGRRGREEQGESRSNTKKKPERKREKESWMNGWRQGGEGMAEEEQVRV